MTKSACVTKGKDKDIDKPRLAVLKILIGAVLLPWRGRTRFLRALGIPTLISVLVWALWTSMAPDDRLAALLVFTPLYLLAFSLFAVTCHRLVLVPAGDNPLALDGMIGRRILRFFAWLLVIYLITALTHMMVMTVVINLPGLATRLTGEGAEPTHQRVVSSMAWLEFMASIPAIYLLGRLSLVLPSIAVDRRLTLKGSWLLTRGNGWRMFVVVGLLPWAMGFLLSLLAREDATILEQALLALVMYAMTAVEIFALSLAFKERILMEAAQQAIE